MSGWRRDLGIMRELLTMTSPKNWRDDAREIVTSRGYGSVGWRDAVLLWAQDYGVYNLGWRSSIIAVADALGVLSPGGWRANLGAIKDYYDTSTRAFVDINMHVLVDSENKVLLER